MSNDLSFVHYYPAEDDIEATPSFSKIHRIPHKK
jgi:hypothetical protein